MPRKYTKNLNISSNKEYMHHEDDYVIKNAKLTLGIYIHDILDSDEPDHEFEITQVSECHLVNTKLLTFFINDFSLWSYKEINDLKSETFYQVTFKLKDADNFIVENICNIFSIHI